MAVPQPLSSDAIAEALASLPGWSLEDDKLHKTFRLPNFRHAMAFLVRVGFEAEQRNHHAELFNVYGTVKVWITTHDAGDRVTGWDVELARAIEAL